MKTLEFFYEGLAPLDNLIALAPVDDLLFFDIETTGLSKAKNHIYLIGVGFYTNDGLKIIQWFAENEVEEVYVLNEFLEFSHSFSYLINYNGKSFDIPFTTERMNKYSLVMPTLISIDIYNLVKPLKRILSLHDMTQKSVEQFLKISREDKYNGGELISVYKKYTYAHSESDLELLITHNKEDVLNMHFLTKILDYSILPEAEISFDSFIINEYHDYNDNSKSELILSGLHNLSSLPRSFNTFKNTSTGSFIMSFSKDNSLRIRLPIIEASLDYYFENYKDYYYLPKENICILKSMGGGVLKENRVNATKENCKVSLSSQFLPMPQNAVISGIRIFKNSYKSKQHYIRFKDFESMDKDSKSSLLNLYYRFFFE